jgi:membrane-associated protease RseP (regulator of RpoE activity)
MSKSLFLLASGLLGCGAVYPQLETPVRSPPPHVTLTPPPPEDLVFLKFVSAAIPSRTRDGRKWDSIGGSLPDAFAKLSVDDKVIFETPVQSDTLTPTWPNQRLANYRIRPGTSVKVELWDSNTLNNHPICLSTVRLEPAEAPLQIECSSGAELRLAVQPAHGRLGIGMFYELRQEEVVVTRVLQESPAARAGLVRGDQLLKIEGKAVKSMQDGEVQSLINANAATGVGILVRKQDRTEVTLSLKEGAIYPVSGEGVAIDG